MPVGLRQRGRSAIQPPASFAKLERPSDTPSITPRAAAGAPRLARNAGRIDVAASCPQSEKRLARPTPSTPRVSQRFCAGDAMTCSLTDALCASPYKTQQPKSEGDQQEVRFSIFDFRFSIFDFRFSIFDFRF